MTRGPGSTALQPLLRLLLIVCALVAPALADTIHIPADQKTIQAGIDAANPGDTVLVAPGTYYENIDFKGKAITVTSSAGAATTIIDGGSSAAAATFQSGETRASTLSGFTIQHGGVLNYYGSVSGVYVEGSSPTILNNIITLNNCYGISVKSAAPLIQGNEISATQDPDAACSFGGGAGIYIDGNLNASNPAANDGTLPVIFGNVIENNVESGYEDAGGNGGAGIAVWGGQALIQNNIIRNNTTAGTAGAINVVYGGMILYQNLIYGNTGSCVAAIDLGTGGESITNYLANNTIVDNSIITVNAGYGCTSEGAGYTGQVNVGDFGNVTVNNIIAASTTEAILVCSGGTLPNGLLDHNLFYNPTGSIFASPCAASEIGTYGNISADPAFADRAAKNYQLTPSSPAIDAGNTSALQYLADSGADTTKDFAGNPRLQDATGVGYPIIDIGAYELTGATDNGSTTILLTPSTVMARGGDQVTFAATILSAKGVPTGDLTLFQDGANVSHTAIGSSGIVTFLSPGLSPGLHSFIATYPGQGVFTPAVSVKVIVLVDKYQPHLTLDISPNPGVVNQPVTLTISLTSTDKLILSPVVLSDGTNTLESLQPDANGNASYTSSSFAIGYHNISASYAGDATHSSANAVVELQVVDGYTTNTTLISSANPSNFNQSVTFSAQVTAANGTPTGNVTFTDGQTALATKPLTSSASATYTTSALTAGPHTISVTYNPTGGFETSNASLTQQVNGFPTESVLSSSQAVGPYSSFITLTASVIPVPQPGPANVAGNVNFYINSALVGSGVLYQNSPNIGVAGYGIGTLPVGTNTVTCEYLGSATYASSVCAPYTIKIVPNTTILAISASPNPAHAFQPITLAAQLSSSTATVLPTGSIAFFANGASIGAAPLSALGIATLSANLPAGSPVITATYAGTTGYNAAAAKPVTELITPDTTTTTLTISPTTAPQGTAIVLTAQVAPSHSQTAPSGNIAFVDGATTLATVPVSATGGATFTSSTFSVGTHTLIAVYSGSPNDLPSTSAPQTLTINAQDFAINAPPPVTLQTGYHTTIKLTLTSTGSFADTVALNCTDLPQWATCTFDNAAPVLGANQTIPSSLYLDTDAVLGYKSELRSPLALRTGIALAMLLPLGMLASPRRRHLLRRSTLLLALVLTGSLFALTGCSGLYPPSTPPGTYTITLTGHGTQTGQTHTTTFTLIVTP